jgi:hypothetical protein
VNVSERVSERKYSRMCNIGNNIPVFSCYLFLYYIPLSIVFSELLGLPRRQIYHRDIILYDITKTRLAKPASQNRVPYIQSYKRQRERVKERETENEREEKQEDRYRRNERNTTSDQPTDPMK